MGHEVRRDRNSVMSFMEQCQCCADIFWEMYTGSATLRAYMLARLTSSNLLPPSLSSCRIPSAVNTQ